MQVTLCRLRTHQWCFILFNVVLFHALLFGADFMEEYLLPSVPFSYTDAKFMEIREQARKLDMHLMKDNISQSHPIAEPDACSGRDVFLLTVIFSNPENKSRRERIRHTWGNVTAFKGRALITVFVMGRPASESTQSELENESRNHKDIVEGSFMDSPRNETLKMTMIIEWVVTFCPDARFVLKTDENMFVNIKSLADHLLGLETQSEDLYLGRVIHRGIPSRDTQSPDYVPSSSYSETYYPDYCSGAAVVMSQDVTRKIYIVSGHVSTLVPSDVFVGICAHRAGILSTHSSRFSGSRHVSYNRCCYKFIFSSSVEENELSMAWRDMNEGEDCTLMKTYYGLVSCKVWTYIDKLKYLNKDTMKENTKSF